jgi:chromate transporter
MFCAACQHYLAARSCENSVQIYHCERDRPRIQVQNETRERLTRAQLFLIFFKAGCAFGGGLGILAVLEHELVTKRQLITHDEFLTTYAIGRLVPSGTMTALAVAYGQKFAGFPGTVIALVALTLPAFVLTVGLTIAYASMMDSALLDVLPVTIMPAALALIVVAALRLGKGTLSRHRELALAVAAFLVAAFTGANAALLLVLGGIAGMLAFSGEVKGESAKEAKGATR